MAVPSRVQCYAPTVNEVSTARFATRDPPVMGPMTLRPLGGTYPWVYHLTADYPNLLTAVRREGEWGIGERT